MEETAARQDEMPVRWCVFSDRRKGKRSLMPWASEAGHLEEIGLLCGSSPTWLVLLKEALLADL